MFDVDKKKEKYLLHNSDRNNTQLKYVFECIESVEKEYAKDIVDMEHDELLKCFSKIEYSSNQMLKRYMLDLRHYFEFYKNNAMKYFNLNNMQLVCTRKGKNIYTYDDIKKIVDEISLSMESYWYYNSILLMRFAGFELADMVEAKVSDITETGIYIPRIGREVKFSDLPELRPHLELTVKNKSEYATNRKNNVFYGISEDSIFRSQMRKENPSREEIYASVKWAMVKSAETKINSSIEAKVNFSLIYKSGIVHYVENELKCKHNIKLKDCCEIERGDIKNRLIKKYLLEYGTGMYLDEFKLYVVDYISKSV